MLNVKFQTGVFRWSFLGLPDGDVAPKHTSGTTTFYGGNYDDCGDVNFDPAAELSLVKSQCLQCSLTRRFLWSKANVFNVLCQRKQARTLRTYRSAGRPTYTTFSEMHIKHPKKTNASRGLNRTSVPPVINPGTSDRGTLTRLKHCRCSKLTFTPFHGRKRRVLSILYLKGASKFVLRTPCSGRGFAENLSAQSGWALMFYL